jgi:hypothetical protein
VKRFIVVLVVLAGGLAWASLGAPSNAATVNGTAISQDRLNDDLSAIAGSAQYQCYLAADEYVSSNGEQELPQVDGASQSEGAGPHPTVTTAFASYYLDTLIGHQFLLNEAAHRDLHPTSTQIESAKADLTAQITDTMSEASQVQSELSACAGLGTLTGAEVLATVPPSFVQQTATFDATGELLVNALAPPTAGDEKKYLAAHQSAFDTVCITVAQYSSQSDATAGYSKVSSGTPFAQVAASAATGSGPQGCQVLYGIANELSSVTDLFTLKDNVVTKPIAVDGSYLLLDITSRTPTSFAKARSAVRAALQQSGNTDVQRLLLKKEGHSAVTVNPRYGTWKPATAQILVPTTPTVDDVLNPVVNDPGSASSATPATSGGSTTPSSGSSG